MKQRRCHALRAALEALEARELLATIIWDGGPGGTGTDWHNPVNWAGDVLPGSGDDAALGPGAAVAISGLAEVLRVTSDRALTVLGTLSVADASQLNAGLMLSGTLSGAGEVAVGGTLDWVGGTMTGPGLTRTLAGGTMNISGGTHDLMRTLVVEGAAFWTNGAIRLNGGTIDNTGSFTAAAAGLLSSFGAGGINAFNNLGTFTKSGSGETRFTVSGAPVAFNNSGSVVIQAGTLLLGGGGSSNATFHASPGGTLLLADSYTYAAGGSVSGGGTIAFTGGTHSLPAGQFNPSGTVNFAGGVVTISNPFAPSVLGPIDGTVTFSAAVNYSGPVTITGSASFAGPQSFSALSLFGSLAGAGEITIVQTLAWTFGGMSGSGRTVIAAGASVDLSGTSTKTLGRRLDNHGSAAWTGGALAFAGGTLNNFGTLTIDTAGTLLAYGNSGVNALNNSGLLQKLGPGGAQLTVNVTGVQLVNSGTTTILAGTLTLGGGGTNTGGINVAAAGTAVFSGSYTHGAAGSLAGAGAITFSGGAHALPPGQFIPSGAVNFTGGTITVGGGITPASLGVIGGAVTFSAALAYSGTLQVTGSVSFAAAQTLSGLTLSGTLAGAGDVSVSGTLTWTGGAMTGTGRTIISGPGTLLISGGGTHTLSRTLVNNGTALWTSGPLSLSGGTISNAGSFTADAIGTLQCSGAAGSNAFNNAGTFVKAGPGTVLFSAAGSAAPFHNTGVVQILAGTLTLGAGGSTSVNLSAGAGATLEFAGGFTILPGGSISGPGTIAFTGGTINLPAGAFTPTGTVNFTGGIVTVNNAINPAQLGVIAGTVHFNAAQTFDTLTLAGTLGGSGDVTVTGSLAWQAGAMVGAGKTILAPSASLLMEGSSTLALARTLSNGGSGLWTSGDLLMGGGTLANLAGATLTIQAAAPILISGSAGSSTFTNAGTIVKTAGGQFEVGISGTSVVFTNHAAGLVNVLAGTWRFAAGQGSNQGTMTAAAGGSLSFANTFTHGASGTLGGGGDVTFLSGTHVLPAGAFSPGGTVTFSGGTVTVNNSFTPGVLGPIAGTVVFNAPLLYAGAVDITGSASFAQDQTFPALSLTGTLSGAGDITVTGALDWTGGSMAGTGRTVVGPGATLTLAGTSRSLARSLEVFGAAMWTEGNTALNSGTFRIAAGGSLDADASGPLAFTGSGTLEVLGALTKLGPGRLDAGSLTLSNSGSLTVLGGVLAIGGGASSNPITIGPGGTLELGGTLTPSAGFSGAGALTITGGTHAFAVGTLNVGTVNFSGGTSTISGPFAPAALGPIGGNVTFSGPLTYATPLAVTGTVSFAQAVVLTDLTLSANGTISGAGNLTVTGALTWQGGTLSGTGVTTVAVGATLAISGSGAKTLARMLVIEGAATWSAGAITLSGAAIVVESAGSFTISNSGAVQMSGVSGVNSLEIRGALTKTGAGTASLSATGTGVALVNLGAVALNAGTLSVAGGSSSTPLIVETGAGLILAGDFALGAGGSISGPGSVTISSGTHAFGNGQFTPTGPVAFTGGSVTLGTGFAPGTLAAIAGTVTFAAGLDYSGPVTVTGSASFAIAQSFASLTLSGTLGGAGSVTITGSLIWTGGVMSGTGATTIAPGATLTLSGGTRTLGRVLSLAGTGSWSAGNMVFSGGALVIQNTGALTVSVAGTVTASGSGGINTISNQGTLTKLGAGILQLPAGGNGVVLDNTGTLIVQAGSLAVLSPLAQVSGDTLTGGTWHVHAGGALTLPAAVAIRTSAASVVLQGPGSSFAALSGLTSNQGTLTLADGRAFNFLPVGGVFNNPGTFIKAGIGNVTVPAGITFNNAGTVVAQNGILTFGGPVPQISGGTLTGGTWSVTAPGTLVLPATITTNNATVLLHAQGSTFSAVNGITTNNGTFAVTGGRTYTTPFLVNHGTVTIGAGTTITVSGAYTQSSAGLLRSEVAAASSLGRLSVGGVATLSGGFHVAWAPGYLPAFGSSFDFLAASTVQGAFTSATSSSIGHLRTLVWQYTPTGFRLVVLLLIRQQR